MKKTRGLWFAPSACLLVLLFVLAALPAVAVDEATEEVPTKLIKMTAENWRWSPELIRVPQGSHVTIEFQSFDASHSFEMKGYKLKVPLPEGKKGQVEFVADKAGTFRWKCGRPCGNGCAKMTGKLVVEPPAEAEENVQ